MTDLELIEYYANLLIIQYSGKPKAEATIRAYLSVIQLYELMQSVRNGYDLDTAEGAQLDILGKYIGSDRTVTGIVFDRDYFGYLLYSETPPKSGVKGYQTYSQDVDAQYFKYESDEQSIFDLTDTEYRDILKLKVIQNYSNHSVKSIDDLFVDLFGVGKVIFDDNFNMTIDYIFDISVERIVTIAQSEGLLPKPMAVGMEISFVSDITQIFGYTNYNDTTPDFVRGYLRYTDNDEGSFLTYG